VERRDPVSAAWLGERLAEPARELGVALPPGALEGLAVHASLVLAWGARINLTGARTPEALVDEHLADALALLPHLPAGPFVFADVGSGAGLPGLVLALLRADATGALLEPTGKKHTFLAHAIRTLGLTGRVTARAERLEDHLRTGGRGAYDVAVSRAVWPAAEWIERGVALLRPGGVAIGVEGTDPGECPPGCERHPYPIRGRIRSLLLRRV
jgi:16S rRNA (guanine527-N7)-methyltransferase